VRLLGRAGLSVANQPTTLFKKNCKMADAAMIFALYP
jgi:hypothetical protein